MSLGITCTDLCATSAYIRTYFYVDKIRFVDMEYSGYNYRGFEIAHHFCEFAGNLVLDVLCIIAGFPVQQIENISIIVLCRISFLLKLYTSVVCI